MALSRLSVARWIAIVAALAPAVFAAPVTTTVNIVATNGAQSFNPNPVTAATGDSLIWRNSDTLTHRIVLDDGSLDTGNIAPGASSTPMVLTGTGGRYHCSIHPSMVGTITAPCVFTLAPTSASAPATASSGTVTVTTASGCTWTAVSNSAFISVTSGASGNGDGTVGYSVAANTSTSSRSGSITIAGQTFPVTQAAQSTGTITGAVYAALGISVHNPDPPLASTPVQLFDSSGTLVKTATSSSTGAYALDNVAAGTYYVRTSTPTTWGFFDEVYNNVRCTPCDVTTGTPVVVSAGATTSGINFSLTRVPPTVVTNPATGITAFTATLNATVNPNGTGTGASVSFTAGPSIPSIQFVPVSVNPGTAPVAVSLLATGLSCDTLYTFHAIAQNAPFVSVSGADLTFRTLGCPPTISPVSNLITRTNIPVVVPLTIGSTAGAAGVVLAANSSKPGLISDLAFSGSGASRTLTITPAANQRGATTITVTGSDPTGTTAMPFVLLVGSQPRGDFDADARADILWRHDSGATMIWLMDGTQRTGTWDVGTVDPAWQINRINDFNADGVADILWRHTAGDVTMWLLSGLYYGDRIIGGGPVGTALYYQIAGTGDVNGDGRCDILWRGADGTLSIWLMDGVRRTLAADIATVDLEWQIAGLADFNGDGRVDILWRHTSGALVIWLMNGTQVVGGGVVGAVDPAWQIVGTADYNGDLSSDILWRHSSGAVTIWLMNGTSVIGGGQIATVDPAWVIVGTGDYNGDERSDILWRHTSGTATLWLMNGLQVIGGGQIGGLDLSWQITSSR